MINIPQAFQTGQGNWQAVKRKFTRSCNNSEKETLRTDLIFSACTLRWSLPVDLAGDGLNDAQLGEDGAVSDDSYIHTSSEFYNIYKQQNMWTLCYFITSSFLSQG